MRSWRADGILNEGKRAFFPVMKKNSQMKETGGWEWYAFSADGKMLDKDPKKDCLTCHESVERFGLCLFQAFEVVESSLLA